MFNLVSDLFLVNLEEISQGVKRKSPVTITEQNYTWRGKPL